MHSHERASKNNHPETTSQWNLTAPNTPSETSANVHAETAPNTTEAVPRFPEDPTQYTEAELQQDPAKRYHVNPADFPIFSQQAELGPNWGDRAETLPLDETMGRFVTATADTIAVIAGEDEGFQSKELPAADHVIYLDKSARPVSWLVNTFWDDFTDKTRPKHSYLAIDRKEWFARTDTPIESNEYIREADGSARVATFSDFRKENVTREDLARIRALYIPGGIDTEDVDEIMSTPTSLEGKNITIIDEVSRSGSTLAIAQYLVSQAIPEAASVNGYTFWKSSFQQSPYGSEHQMRGVPVWYDSSTHVGRGIGDVNEEFFKARYEKYPNAKTRAQKFGAIVLGEYINLAAEPGNRSRQLASEIQTMRKEYDAGHILMPMPNHYNTDKWVERTEAQGVHFAPPKRNQPAPKNSYIGIMDDIHHRPPVESH